MKPTTERVVSSRKRTKMLLGADAPAQTRARARSTAGTVTARCAAQERPAVEPGALDQDELEQEQRADVAHVVDRLGEPAARAASRPRSVAWKSARLGPREPGSLPTGSISPRRSSSSSAR